MPWQAWQTSNPARKTLWIACSLLWLALFLLFARSLDLNIPYLPLAIAGGLAFYLRLSPRIPELVAWIAISAAFGLVVRSPRDHSWINGGSGILALFGLGGFVMLGLRWLWSEGTARRQAYAMFAPAAALVFFVFSAQRALSLANLLYPKTFDLYLYAFDGSFGFQPSFFAGKAMAASFVLRIACLLTYVSLPFVMALVYALAMPKGTERPSWDLITLFLLAGIGGWALYNVVPATGPAYVFGADFPWHWLPYHSLSKLFLERLPVNPDIPRNAIPSLHMAWVVLLVWNAKTFSHGLRIFLGVYLALTVVATLGIGEHYFVDLVAGLPFALFVQTVVSPGAKPPLSNRVAASALALGLTLAWLLLTRFGTRLVLASPTIPWLLVAAIGVALWRIKAWATPKADSSPSRDVAPQTLAMGAHV